MSIISSTSLKKRKTAPRWSIKTLGSKKSFDEDLLEGINGNAPPGEEQIGLKAGTVPQVQAHNPSEPAGACPANLSPFSLPSAV